MSVYLVVAAVVLVTVTGDFLLKLAAQAPDTFRTPAFWGGAALYMLTAVGWTLVMRNLPLATIGVFYAVLTILLLTALGVFVFGETITAREGLGIALAVASLMLMARFA